MHPSIATATGNMNNMLTSMHLNVGASSYYIIDKFPLPGVAGLGSKNAANFPTSFPWGPVRHVTAFPNLSMDFVVVQFDCMSKNCTTSHAILYSEMMLSRIVCFVIELDINRTSEKFRNSPFSNLLWLSARSVTFESVCLRK
jgi:hypothetical protein